MDVPDILRFLQKMASAGSGHPSRREEEEMESIDNLDERTLRVNSLYTPGNIYPDHLPYPVTNQIMKYHRLANAELAPKKFVNVELRRFNEYSKYLNRRLSPETLRPSFIRKLQLMIRIVKDCERLGPEELEYLSAKVLELVEVGNIQNDEAGLNMQFRNLNEHH